MYSIPLEKKNFFFFSHSGEKKKSHIAKDQFQRGFSGCFCYRGRIETTFFSGPSRLIPCHVGRFTSEAVDHCKLVNWRQSTDLETLWGIVSSLSWVNWLVGIWPCQTLVWILCVYLRLSSPSYRWENNEVQRENQGYPNRRPSSPYRLSREGLRRRLWPRLLFFFLFWSWLRKSSTLKINWENVDRKGEGRAWHVCVCERYAKYSYRERTLTMKIKPKLCLENLKWDTVRSVKRRVSKSLASIRIFH